MRFGAAPPRPRSRDKTPCKHSAHSWAKRPVALERKTLANPAAKQLPLPSGGLGCGAGARQVVLEGAPGALREGSYLVDPASSHMLVSKIKPCMSKYKLLIL